MVANTNTRKLGVLDKGICVAQCYQDHGRSINGAACAAKCAMGNKRNLFVLGKGICAAQCYEYFGKKPDGAACAAKCAVIGSRLRRADVLGKGICAAECYQKNGASIAGAACAAHCATGTIRRADVLGKGICAAECYQKHGKSIDGAQCAAHCAMGTLRRVDMISNGICAAKCAQKGMSIDGAACLAHCAVGRRLNNVRRSNKKMAACVAKCLVGSGGKIDKAACSAKCTFSKRRADMLSNGICAAKCTQKGMSIDGAACLAHCAIDRRAEIENKVRKLLKNIRRASVTDKATSSKRRLQATLVASAVFGDFIKNPDHLTAFADATKHAVTDTVDIVKDVATMITSATSDDTKVFNMTDKRIVWYTYNEASPFKFNTPFHTTMEAKGFAILHCLGWGRISVYADNQGSGYTLERGKSYIYGVNGFTPIPTGVRRRLN